MIFEATTSDGWFGLLCLVKSRERSCVEVEVDVYVRLLMRD